MRRWALGALLAWAGCTDCKENQTRAQALVERYRACAPGDACVVVDLYSLAGANNCVGALQCSAGFKAGSDLDAFRREATAIVADQRSCSECVSAGCAQPATTASCKADPDHAGRYRCSPDGAP